LISSWFFSWTATFSLFSRPVIRMCALHNKSIMMTEYNIKNILFELSVLLI
jgi:hypothetical protein